MINPLPRTLLAPSSLHDHVTPPSPRYVYTFLEAYQPSSNRPYAHLTSPHLTL